MNIGKTIAELRREVKISQGELAERAGLTQASLSHIENGNTKRPSINSLAPICEVLGISIAELHIFSLEATDYPEKNRDGYEVIFPAIKLLMKSIRKL